MSLGSIYRPFSSVEIEPQPERALIRIEFISHMAPLFPVEIEPQPERALIPDFSAKPWISSFVVEMEHQPERALILSKALAVNLLFARRNRAPARKGITEH